MPVSPSSVRQLLVWPARVLDTTGLTLPHVSVATRHRRLVSDPNRPEGWLALQSGLATLGDDATWTSFVARGATALAVGGVHGRDRDQAYQRFRDEAVAIGLKRQAVYPVRAEDLDAATGAGFRTVPIGVEAWVDLDDFTLRGKRFADLRQMRNRAATHGIEVEEVAPSGWQSKLDATWDAFLAARAVPWRIRWLSGAPALSDLRGRRVFVAHAAGRVQAFCTVLPGPSGIWSLDVMCRHPQARPGSMEGLLVQALHQLKAEGARSVSLGPCPLAGSEVQRVPGILGALFRAAFGSTLGDRWFGFRRLATFKAKFRPRYEPVQLGIAPLLSPLALYLVARIWALDD